MGKSEHSRSSSSYGQVWGRAECKKSMQTQIIWDIKEPQEKSKYVQGGRIDFPKVIYLIGASLNALGGTFEIYFNRPNGKF